MYVAVCGAVGYKIDAMIARLIAVGYKIDAMIVRLIVKCWLLILLETA